MDPFQHKWAVQTRLIKREKNITAHICQVSFYLWIEMGYVHMVFDSYTDFVQ